MRVYMEDLCQVLTRQSEYREIWCSAMVNRELDKGRIFTYRGVELEIWE